MYIISKDSKIVTHDIYILITWYSNDRVAQNIFLFKFKKYTLFRPVLSTVKPGYLYELVPPEAPVKGEDWKTVLADVENIIMPGITHWNSPQFHAFFPTGNSYPAIIGDMLCNGIGSIGFSWVRINIHNIENALLRRREKVSRRYLKKILLQETIIRMQRTILEILGIVYLHFSDNL